MKNKLTGSQIRLLICLVVVAIFSLSYQYIYTEFENLADSYSTKTKTTNQLIRQRQDDLAKEEEYKSKTEEMTQKCEAIINAYPVNITKEDDLIFIEKLEKALNITIPSANISIADNIQVYQTILPIRDKDGNEILGSASSTPTTAAATDTGAVTPAVLSDTTDTSATGAEATTTASDTATTDKSATSTGNSATVAGNTATLSQTELSDTSSSNSSNNTTTRTADTGTDTSGATASGTNTSENASSGNTVLGTDTGSAGAASANPSGQQYMKALQSRITITFQTTNRDFRKLVDYLNQYPEKLSITDASLSYDNSTGQLMANMTINRYALTGTGKVYEEPYIGDIRIGTKDLFGTETDKNNKAKSNRAESNTAKSNSVNKN
jgi:hypothetical protein